VTNASALSAASRERDPLWFAPLFVVGPARSYTSVIVSMLGQHPELYAFPELLLFRSDTVSGLLTSPSGVKGPPVNSRLSGLLRALAQVHDGEQTPDGVVRASEWLQARRSWRTEEIFDHLLTAIGPRLGVEKSPENSGRRDFLVRMTTSYPRARYLHIVRHPLSTALSMYRAWTPLGYWDVSPALFGQFCLGVWYSHHRRLMRLSNTLPPDRYLRVRAEDIVGDPLRTLPQICRWLGVPDSEPMIEQMCHPEHSPFASLGPEGAIGGYDPLFLRDPKLRGAPIPASFELPDDWVVDPWFHLGVIRLAYQLGYAPAHAEPLAA
jgi:sulfotransferase family protein